MILGNTALPPSLALFDSLACVEVEVTVRNKAVCSSRGVCPIIDNENDCCCSYGGADACLVPRNVRN